MSGDTTIDAVRLALGLQDMRARVAATNVANASRPGAQAMRVDAAALQSLLEEVAQAAQGQDAALADRLRQAVADLAQTPAIAAAEGIRVDAEVGDMVAASTAYQALSEALSRQFGLMRLAVAGRS